MALYTDTSTGGTGLTPAQIAQLNKSGKYQGEFNAGVNYLTGEVVDSDNVAYIKLDNSAATGNDPYIDNTVWKAVGGEKLVTVVPPQPVSINAPEFIFDTVETKRYRLDTSTADPIYVPADGSTGGNGLTGDQSAILDAAGASLAGYTEKAYTYESGYYRDNSGAEVANGSFNRFMYTIQDGDMGFRVSAEVVSQVTALAVYYDVDDNYLGFEFDGTNSSVIYTNQVLTLPPGTAKIGFSNRVIEQDHKLEVINVQPNVYDDVEKLKTTSYGLPVAIFGDSTSIFGNNGLGSELAALLPNRTFYQQGIGSQAWDESIVFRIGARNTTVTVTGGVIPSSGAAVACTLANNILAQPSALSSVMQVMVSGVRCELAKDTSDNYTLQAMDSIAADVTVTAGSDVKVISSADSGNSPDIANTVPLSDMLSGVILIRTLPSINDRAAFDDRGAMESLVEEVLGHLTKYTNRIALCSIMNGEKDLVMPIGQNATEAESYSTLSAVRDLNIYIRNRWPHFIDLQQNHIDNGGSTARTISGVSFEVLNTITTDPVNGVLGVDGRHEDQPAIDSSAQVVADYIDARW